jgi:serine/threonine protein kinase
MAQLGAGQDRKPTEGATPGAPERGTASPHSTAGLGLVPSDRNSPSEQFGRYRILRKLGQGGMGAVYLAQDTQLDRAVALKVPHFSADDSPSLRERFYREARSAATLEHPNLCPVYDVGQEQGVHYLTMAYVEGQSLSAVLASGAPLPQEQAARIVWTLAQALGYAHSRGIIHRDLKPANVMLRTNGEPVIMDFGLARRNNPGEERLTRSGAVMGTPAYMAPEQVEGKVEDCGPGCDVYSLGVILYELVTGRLPFAGPVTAVFVQILTTEPERPSRLRPDLSPRLEAIIRQAMAKQSQNRYASADRLAEDLDAYLQGAAGVPRPASRIEQPSDQSGGASATALLVDVPAPRLNARRALPRRLWMVVAAAGVVTLGLVGLALVPRAPPKDRLSTGTVQQDPVAEHPAHPGFPNESQPAPRSDPVVAGGDRPLASGKHDQGLIVEVLEVKPDDDELLLVRWRYRNPTPRTVELIAATPPFRGVDSPPNTAANFWASVFYRAGKSTPGRVSAQHVVEQGRSDLYAKDLGREAVRLRPEQEFEVWARFPLPPQSVRTITLYLLETAPLRDIPIQDAGK